MENENTQEPVEAKNGGGLAGEVLDNSFDLQAYADGIMDFIDTSSSSDSDDNTVALSTKIKELETINLDFEKKHQRLLADFQNYRNRTSKDIQSGVEQAEKQIVLEILQVFDSFGRCLNSTYQNIEDFRVGVEQIEKQFSSTLRRLKVTEIEIKPGDAFDAHTAEALTAVDTSDFPAGSIMDICEKGFRIGDRLLRPAKVVVARNESSN